MYNKEKKRQYYLRNKERILEKRKEYYENNKEKHKESMKLYREEHKDYFKSYRKKYYESHEEQIKQYQKDYSEKRNEGNKRRYSKNPELFKERSQHYRDTHKLIIKGRVKQKYVLNKESEKERQHKYYLTHKEGIRIRNMKRKRFIETNIILNEQFSMSDLHHVENGVGMYIPRQMHKSVRHRLTDGYNMDIINSKVAHWIRENNIEISGVVK